MTAADLANREALEALGRRGLTGHPLGSDGFSRRWNGRRGMASRPTGPAARRQARRQTPAARNYILSRV